MSWILISLLAPALYGASSFIDRFLIDKYIKGFLFLTILSGFVSVSLGMIILALNGFPTLSPVNMAIVLLSGIFFEIALLPYYKAISLEDVSRVVPLFQAIPVFTLIFSYILLGEVLPLNGLIGFFLVLVGGFLLATDKFDAKIFHFRKFFWYMMLASILYALPGVMFKYVVISGSFWDTLAYEFIGGGIGAAILMTWSHFYNGKFFAEIPEVPRKVWGIVYANEGVYILARFCTFYAIMLGPVSLVSALGGSGPFFTFLYGLILSVWFPQIIKEDMHRSVIIAKLIAICLIFFGALIINMNGIFF